MDGSLLTEIVFLDFFQDWGFNLTASLFIFWQAPHFLTHVFKTIKIPSVLKEFFWEWFLFY